MLHLEMTATVSFTASNICDLHLIFTLATWQNICLPRGVEMPTLILNINILEKLLTSRKKRGLSGMVVRAQMAATEGKAHTKTKTRQLWN